MKVTIEPSRGIHGRCYNENNEGSLKFELKSFELGIVDEDDGEAGIEVFMHTFNPDENGTYIYTTLTPVEAELLADNLRKFAEIYRNQI